MFNKNLFLNQHVKRIDDLNEEAKRLKSDVLKEAQAQSSDQVTKITGKIAVLEKEDASHRLASTTTTVIKTKAEVNDEIKVKDKNSPKSSCDSPSKSAECHRK